MNQNSLADLIVRSVPLTEFMGVEVEACSLNKVVLTAPLEKNLNHKKTAFGGSLTGLQALCCWSWIMNFLHEKNIVAEVVLQNSVSQFLLPGTSDLVAQCLSPEPAELVKFTEALQKKGKARLELHSQVLVNGNVATKFTGRYVAFTK